MESHGASLDVHSQAVFATYCAQCHGVTGHGGYVGARAIAPAIAGADEAKVSQQVRTGSDHMPARSTALIPDATLGELGKYVHEALARPAQEPGRVGPRALDPFELGIIVWGAFALFACVLALLFAEGRN